MEPQTPVINPADLLTPAELSARLKVRPTYIYEKMRPAVANPLPGIKMGRYWRFHWPTVSAWLLAQSTAVPKKARAR